MARNNNQTGGARINMLWCFRDDHVSYRQFILPQYTTLKFLRHRSISNQLYEIGWGLLSQFTGVGKGLEYISILHWRLGVF
jgi:hypothetical protein